MIVNPEKFQSIIVNNKISGTSNLNISLTVDGKLINPESNVTLLGLNIDNKLNFEDHISTLCKRSAGQLNALCRIKSFLGINERKAIVNSFIYANFNYCPLVWHFCSKRTMEKIENIQKRALRFLCNDYSSSYEKLLEKNKSCTMEIRRLRTLALEIYKTLNDMNPTFMKDLFHLRENTLRRPNDLNVPVRNSVKFGDKSLRSLGPTIWNLLPNNIRTTNSFSQFKTFLTTWFGPKCKCNLCCLSRI